LFGANQDLAWVIFSIVVIWLFIVVLLALFVYDLRWGELPNKWTLGGSAVLVVVTLLALLVDQPLLWQPTNPAVSITQVIETFSSGILAALFFGFILVLSEFILHKPGMGMGDVKLALLLGLLLGFPGIVVGLYLAFIFGA